MWPRDEFGIVRRSAALDVGLTDTDLKRAVRDGELIVLDRGALLPTSALPQYDVDDAVYRWKVVAAAAGQTCSLSHESAAAFHGLELLKPERTVVHFAKRRNGGGRRTATRHFHSGLPDDAVVHVDGIAVSTMARTAIDVAATSNFPRALTVIDSALRHGATMEELRAEAGRHRVRGAGMVRSALKYGDGRSANPGESWGRAQMITSRLPLPDLQVEFVLEDGSIAIVDYCWDGIVVGEFDGLRKFCRDLRPGERVEDAVVREKIREDRLRDLVRHVGRWIWRDLENRTMVDRMRAKLEDAGLA
ncbi:hypothetical protein [Gordonia spumicola]|uniref:hypothetical protein n=1 Tax=Gordonia spumicola TaxID=589161 RepID=UPI00137A5CBA|nr:hypothetical protein [Gordonia spumicola]